MAGTLNGSRLGWGFEPARTAPMHHFVMARPLDEREREMLDVLLSLEAPGIAELREQAATARVERRCECGCASVDLDVDRNATPPSPLGRRYGPAIRTITRPLPIPPHAKLTDLTGAEVKDAYVFFTVHLWVDEDGWLAGMRITDLVLDSPGDAYSFPPSEDFYPPHLEARPRARRRRRRFRIWRQ